MQKTRVRRKLAIILAACLGLSLGIVVVSPAGGVTAANAYDAQAFNPGNIIDDALFYDGAAMTAQEIQAFLNTRVPRCQLGDRGYEVGKAARWSGEDTRLASACLRDYRSSTSTRAANSYCSTYVGASNETAAQTIAKVSSACGISPRVLLVMLEKEQSLISDSWPNELQYFRAMGYACPDSGPNGSAACDPSQGGFAQQVYRAAWQFKVYKALPGSYNYRVGWNQIQWSTSAACGTSHVKIENSATAALYIYTPYRPNGAAIDAGWGTGDGCSTYGNRNFAKFYSSWFGLLHQSPQVLGDLNDAYPVDNGFVVRGWSGDPKTAQATQNVQIYMGDLGSELSTGQQRNDVAAVYPSLGAKTGFSGAVNGVFSGSHRLCAYSTVELGCRTVDFGINAPRGDVNAVVIEGGQLRVRGWAADLDRDAPLNVHIYVGSEAFSVSANLDRSDVFQAGYGLKRGFDWKADANRWAGTTQKVCVYGINVTPNGAKTGDNRALKTCTSMSFPENRSPVGILQSATNQNGQLALVGWAFDPDSSEAIDVHLYVGAKAYVVRADKPRPDVAKAYGLPTDRHGFVFSLPRESAWGASANVCLYAINVGVGGGAAGRNPQLGCKTVDFGGVQEKGRVPIGDLNGVNVSNGTLTARGWAIDPDSVAPITVHMYVGSRAFVATANQARPDVGSAYPVYGAEHGYVFDVDASQFTGVQQVCVYGINTVVGRNPQLGCKTVDFGVAAP